MDVPVLTVRVLFLALLVTHGEARALEVPPDEADVLKACEQKVCSIILKKEPAGGDVKCKISKTWASDTIKGGETKSVKWGFGDAQCTTHVSMTRKDILAALNKPKHTLTMPNQTVHCKIEREGKLKPLRAKASPRLDFKRGRADKVWINLKDVDGPTDIKALIWTAANLEDSLGIFHKNMIKQINKFIHRRCNEKYGPKAQAEARKKLKKKQRRAERKKARAAKKKAAAAAGDADKTEPAAP